MKLLSRYVGRVVLSSMLMVLLLLLGLDLVFSFLGGIRRIKRGVSSTTSLDVCLVVFTFSSV
jgi:lipopolysaccharide export LptBFGC system permease protein LptF